jgi:predicted nucleotidyltransferase
MIDYSRADPRLLDDITMVVEKLHTTVGLDADCVLIVGASCRDIMHSALGHTFPLRATSDVDLGIAVNDWSISQSIEANFPRIGSNGIRYLVQGLPVDIMPFGAIEEPTGIAHPAARGQDLVVFGFNDVHERASLLTLPTGLTIRIPRPAGYAALKMRSWIDRSAYGEDKDAKDLALVVYWYQESLSVQDRLYEEGRGFDLLASLDFDADLASVRLLASDVADQLVPANTSDLAARWREVDLRLLAQSFVLPSAKSQIPIKRRLELVSQLAL